MRPAEGVSDVGLPIWKKELMLHCKSNYRNTSTATLNKSLRNKEGRKHKKRGDKTCRKSECGGVNSYG